MEEIPLLFMLGEVSNGSPLLLINCNAGQLIYKVSIQKVSINLKLLKP